MGEIYRDDATKGVALGVTGATITGVTIKRDGKADIAGTSLSGAVSIPYAVTVYDGDFKIYWEYTVGGDPYTRYDQHSVVTPYISLADLRDIPDLATKSDAELINMERMVRKLIDGYCHQEFGLYKGEYTVIARGDKKLELPKRILELTSVNVDTVALDTALFSVFGDGKFLGTKSYGGTPDYSVTYTSVIRNPETDYYCFRRDRSYVVDGTWGYYSVPVEIQEAAKILIVDYFCPENSYRDKFVTDVKTQTTALSISGRTYDGTGNARADKLLNEYVVHNWMVV